MMVLVVVSQKEIKPWSFLSHSILFQILVHIQNSIQDLLVLVGFVWLVWSVAAAILKLFYVVLYPTLAPKTQIR